MEYAYTCWAPATYPPLLTIKNTKSKLSIAKTQTQTQNKTHGFKNINDGDDNSLVVKIPLPSHVKSISSTSNPFVKHCLKLRHSSSYRHSHGSALVVGTTPIREIYKFERSLQEGTIRMDCLLLLDTAEVPEGLDDISIRTVRVSSMVMKKLSGVQSTESIEAIALMKIPTSFLNLDVNLKEPDCQSWFPCSHRVLVLDGIQVAPCKFSHVPLDFMLPEGLLGKRNGWQSSLLQCGPYQNIFHIIVTNCTYKRYPEVEENFLRSPDALDPGNLGTLLRSAMAFKWAGVFLLPGCCDPFNEKVLRASRGACFQLPIVSGSWYHLEALKDEFQMKLLAGHPGSHEDSRPVSWLSQEFVDSLAGVSMCLVLGSEGLGLSDKSQRVCELVSIPMAGEFESLNVSVAGGIFLYMLQPKNQKFV